MEKELISIIVPIYNVEKYLNKCVESILKQTYDNLEIILVDDGSLDNCGNICDEYAKKDSRIIVLHKTNGGLSDARNKGINIAKGKYIGFVDSDDYIDNDMFEILYNLCKNNNADISMISYKEIENEIIINENSNYTNKVFKYNNIEAIKELLKDEKIKNYAWNKLYKKELFDGIEYPIKMAYEDVGTTYKLFEKAKKIIWYDIPKYNYIRRGTSIVSKNTYKNLKDFIDLSYQRYNYFENSIYSNKIKIENSYSFIRNMIMFYLNYQIDNIQELDAVFEYYYPLFNKIIEQNYNEIILEMSKQNLIATIYYLIKWNRKKTRNILNIILEERNKEKRGDD